MPSRMSVARYHELIRIGELGPDDRVELLNGRLVERPRTSPGKAAATALTRLALEPLIPVEWHLAQFAPITLATSEPEPSITVVRGRIRDYAARHPSADEVGLLIEVVDVTLTQCRRLRAAICARAGIPLCWIINLNDRQIEVRSDPRPSGPWQRGTYQRRQVYAVSESVPVVLDGQCIAEIATTELLP